MGALDALRCRSYSVASRSKLNSCGGVLKRKLSATVLSFLLLATGAACRDLDAHIAANDGFKAYKNREYDKAIAQYEAALQGMPGDHLLQRNLAFAHIAAARNGAVKEVFDAHMNKAIEILTPMVRAKHDDHELVEQLFSAWSESNRLAEAAQFFLEWANADDSDEAWRLVGQVEAQRGNYPAALVAFKKRIKKSPNDASLKLAVGTLTWEWLRQGGPVDNIEAVNVATEAYESALAADQAGQNNALTYAGLLLRERAKRQANEVDAQADMKKAEELAATARTRATDDSSATAQKTPH